jgi:class 3 adenylate cyclase
MTLPEHTTGAALFADISGFTPLTEAFDRVLGARRGAEELTQRINQLYNALIAQIEHFGGSVMASLATASPAGLLNRSIKAKRPLYLQT